MRMGLCLMPCLAKKKALRLDMQQKLTLRKLLTFRQELCHPEFPNAARGFEGMLEAHRLLQERESAGVLIGGLAHSVWNRMRKQEQLDEHKDVDVLVLSRELELEKPFEAGIDWWLPQRRRVNIRTHGSSVDRNMTWYQNGNGLVLQFGLRVREQEYLFPGLYLLEPELVVSMRLSEAEASVDTRIAPDGIDGEVRERFYKAVAGKMGTCLPGFVANTFRWNVLDSRKIIVEGFDLDDMRAIHAHNDG